MGIMDKIGQVNTLVDGIADKAQKTTDAISNKVDSTTGIVNDGAMLQGWLGNYVTIDVETAQAKWQNMLIGNENVVTAYKLLRDELIITNHRMIFIDVHGKTGQKKMISQIFLDSIIDVTYASAGFGFDDTDMKVVYLVNPYKKALKTEIDEHLFEFPKKADITDFYRYLVELSVNNRKELNA